jgi:hypothetical protein
MNFIMAFFLMVNGGSDEEAFWLFVTLTKKHSKFRREKSFEGGLEGFFVDGFPLLNQFIY